MKVIVFVLAVLAISYAQSPAEPVPDAVPADAAPVEAAPAEPADPAMAEPAVAEPAAAEPAAAEPAAAEPAAAEPAAADPAAVDPAVADPAAADPAAAEPVAPELIPAEPIEPQEVPVTEIAQPELEPTATMIPSASPPGDGYLAGCLAPNGGGLQSVLNDFSQFIPAEQLYRRVIKAILTDSETQQVLAYVSSPEFHDMLVEVIQSPELTAFADYACQELYLDVRHYFNMMLSLFGLPEFPRVTARASPGFRGLFLDMLDMIPTEKLKVMIAERTKTDTFLQQFQTKLGSPEFAAVYTALNNSTMYNQMLTGLRELQVDVDIVLATIHRSII